MARKKKHKKSAKSGISLASAKKKIIAAIRKVKG